ncbi:hypothetical protein MMC18_006389 [Xylographa bjoerkii]|nr:hypothetical protein [Xylographa bjoerkii]
MDAKKFYDGFWTDTYKNLQVLVKETRPDLVFADYQVDAARDLLEECKIPLVTMWPQFPWMMCPQKYVPGQPGMQQTCLTSENATMWQRMYEETYLLRSARTFLGYLFWTRKMRRQAGVTRQLAMPRKPNYLLLVNSFVGLEIAKDLPPLVVAVGPILADDYEPLGSELKTFLTQRRRVVFVAFGTHVILPFATLSKIAEGIQLTLNAHRIDGIIWSIRATARKQFDLAATLPLSSANPDKTAYSDLLQNFHPDWKFVEFAPQRAVLAHSSLALFLTHAGPSSANEALFHGVPMLAMGIYGDQLPNSMRLHAAGVAEMLPKETFTAAEICESQHASSMTPAVYIGETLYACVVSQALRVIESSWRQI